jgi:Xaa-Pro aminopeptidase
MHMRRAHQIDRRAVRTVLAWIAAALAAATLLFLPTVATEQDDAPTTIDSITARQLLSPPAVP